MEICIVAVGGMKEKYLVEAQKKLLAEIRRHARINLVEVCEDDTAYGSIEKEGEKILAAVKDTGRAVLLDPAGSPATENDIRRLIESNVIFVLGGPQGFGENVYSRCKRRISFSGFTFAHRLARLALLEQIEMIIKNIDFIQ